MTFETCNISVSTQLQVKCCIRTYSRPFSILIGEVLSEALRFSITFLPYQQAYMVPGI
jgi:hypothetical protein